MSEPKKCFNDPVHGFISLHPLLVAVIDTPQFQRLRKIKQLGGKYFVYPGASHNRFEHSIGTCHLAGELARHLKAIQEEEKEEGESKITNTDVLCVELAGLCHDLGHGPFSHVFDGLFLPKADKDLDWSHEKGSRDMLDYMFENKKLKEMASEEFDINEEELKFVKDMIDPDKKKIKNDIWPYPERNAKRFLYEIVSNPINGVDVDKWDYFARDCHHLGIKNSFDHRRFMSFMKVLPCEKEGQANHRHLCAREKECKNLYEMFHTRAALHKRAYKHKVAVAVEMMIRDAMVFANDSIKFRDEIIQISETVQDMSGCEAMESANEHIKFGEKVIKMSETVKNMRFYVQLNDLIFERILYSSDNSANMKKARELLERVEKRDLYRCVASKLVEHDSDAEEIKKKFEESASSDIDYEVKKTTFNYGDKNKNPVEKFWFYNKGEKVGTLRKSEEDSYMHPAKYEDVKLEIFLKDKTKDKNILDLLQNCARENGFQIFKCE